MIAFTQMPKYLTCHYQKSVCRSYLTTFVVWFNIADLQVLKARSVRKPAGRCKTVEYFLLPNIAVAIGPSLVTKNVQIVN